MPKVLTHSVVVLLVLAALLIGDSASWANTPGTGPHSSYVPKPGSPCRAGFVKKAVTVTNHEVVNGQVKTVKVKIIECVSKPPPKAKPAPVVTTIVATTTTTTTTIPGPSPLGTAIVLKDSYGDDVSVDAEQVLNPAPPANEFDAAPAGDQLVAVEISITNLASAPFTDDMNNDVTVIGSNSQTYTASFESIAGCTNFDFGDVDLTTGASASGCVSFDIPNGVNPAQVYFLPGADFEGAPAKWNILGG